MNYDISRDRTFWIYVLIVLFVVIIGCGAIITSNIDNSIIIAVVWTLSNVILLFLIYFAAIRWMDEICTPTKRYLNIDSWMWLVVLIVSLITLLFSLLWTGALRNADNEAFLTISSVFVLLGGVVLGLLAVYGNLNDMYMLLPFWTTVVYLLIWYGLALYSAI